MKKSTKATLLSALVFPGAGHIYLKKYLPGVALIGISCAGIYYLLSKAIEQSMQIVDQIQSGAVQPDMAAISDLVSKQSSGPQAEILNIVTIIITICWLGGIIDAYRLGRAKDKIESDNKSREK
jgi:TM2 domain-containing membrane protein YozV